MNTPPNESRTLFIDRNSGGRSFRNLLLKQGLKIVLHDEEFPQTTADEDWLISVGERGWVVITGDKAITSSPLFLLRLLKSKTFVFILYGLNGASPADKAKCVCEAHKTIQNLVTENNPPAIWRIGKDQIARTFNFQKVLARMHKHRRL